MFHVSQTSERFHARGGSYEVEPDKVAQMSHPRKTLPCLGEPKVELNV